MPSYTWTLTDTHKSLLRTAELSTLAAVLQQLQMDYPSDAQVQSLASDNLDLSINTWSHLRHSLTLVWRRNARVTHRCLTGYWEFFVDNVSGRAYWSRFQLPLTPGPFQQAAMGRNMSGTTSPAIWLTQLIFGYREAVNRVNAAHIASD